MKVRQPFILKDKQKELKINVVLKEKIMNLNEVIIKADCPMSLKKGSDDVDTKGVHGDCGVTIYCLKKLDK